MPSLTFTLANGAFLAEQHGDYRLVVSGADDDYRYQIVHTPTGLVISESKSYKHLPNARRFGRRELARAGKG